MTPEKLGSWAFVVGKIAVSVIVLTIVVGAAFFYLGRSSENNLRDIIVAEMERWFADAPDSDPKEGEADMAKKEPPPAAPPAPAPEETAKVEPPPAPAPAAPAPVEAPPAPEMDPAPPEESEMVWTPAPPEEEPEFVPAPPEPPESPHFLDSLSRAYVSIEACEHAKKTGKYGFTFTCPDRADYMINSLDDLVEEAITEDEDEYQPLDDLVEETVRDDEDEYQPLDELVTADTEEDEIDSNVDPEISEGIDG